MAKSINKNLPALARNLPPTPKTSCNDLIKMAIDADSVLAQVREVMLAPYPRKAAPEFTSYQVASILGLSRPQLRNNESKIKSSRGRIKEGTNQKIYTLKETIELYQALGDYSPRPEGKQAKVVVVASYKGGVGKTTTAVSIAQGLTLKGHKVLLMDLDGQGSATMLCGISPEVEVTLEQTIMPYLYNDQPDLRYAPQKTYWDNLDLIPASSSLLAAEFVIPARVSKSSESKYDFWDQIRLGIEPLREIYDVIVVDTNPSLGYLTQNAMTMADMIFSPCPQEALDYASLVQFWGVFAELTAAIPGFSETKEYDCVQVFITKAQSEGDELATAINSWIRGSFGNNLCDIAIPESTAPQKASAEMKTVFEIDGKESSLNSYKRYKEPLDRFINHIDSQLTMAWRR